MELQRFVAFLTNFSEARLCAMDELYAPEVNFADPMNEASDLAHLKRIEADLLKQLGNIRFEVHDQLSGEKTAFLRWTMHYTFRSKKRAIEGTTFLRYNAEGMITYQRDHWDASMGVYGEFPLLGLSMRGIKKLLRVN